MTRTTISKGVALAGLAVATVIGAAAAQADGSIKDGAAPADPGRQLSFSANVGVTTDYVFRGFSQRQENPALQGGLDVGYGLFYVGVWGSGVDFVKGDGGIGSGDAHLEVDWYAGIKPKWGNVTFDFGVIYYQYPGSEKLLTAIPSFEKADYFELKAGASTTFDKFGITGTAFYSPEYTFGTGETLTLEGGVSYELPKFGEITPTLSALLGSTLFSDNSDLDYMYWNAGIGLGFGSNFSLDFRYWGTNNEGFCDVVNLCDDRFVATAKVTLP